MSDLVPVGISYWVVPMRWLHLMLALSLIGGFTPHLSVVFSLMILIGWSADISRARIVCPASLACIVGWTLRIGLPRRYARVVQDVWDVYREELGVVPAEEVLALRDAVSQAFCG